MSIFGRAIEEGVTEGVNAGLDRAIPGLLSRIAGIAVDEAMKRFGEKKEDVTT